MRTKDRRQQQVTPNTPFDELPEWLSIQQVAEYLGTSRWFVYQCVHRGEIPNRRLGKFIQIPKSFFSEEHAAFSVPVTRPFVPTATCGYFGEAVR